MTEMTVAEFMANPPNLDDLLKQVQAGDPDAVELVKAIFAMEKNNAAFAKWASDHRQQLSQFTTAMQGKVIADDRAKKSKAQQAASAQRQRNSQMQCEAAAKAIAVILANDPELKFGQRGIRQTLKQRLEKKGFPLTDKGLSKAITLARNKLPASMTR